MLNAVQTQYLSTIAAQAHAAGHGKKQAIYEKAAQTLNVSIATLHRYLNTIAVRPTRKRRSDAGKMALERKEALLIAGTLMEGIRQNGKQIMTAEHALEILRANNWVTADRVNPSTGEVTPLSTSAVVRALRNYKLHPEQLLAPAPVVEMASKFPNHVWEIDASVCVLYYLSNSDGLRVMEQDVFYKNKPGNVKKIEHEMVWRYVITDHTTGWVFVEYVFGGETGENLCAVFINAMQKRGVTDPVHGVPLLVMLDPGSANTGHLFRNLCKALSVQVQINKPKNPRAKGQVEKGNDIVECSFEAKLSLRRVDSLAELNHEAGRWMVWFNGTKKHSRHGMTRYAAWLRIRPEQLRLAPSVAVCKELAVSAPIKRKVLPTLRVSFNGPEYDVSDVPGVIVGEKLLVTRNPWRTQSINVVTFDADGKEMFHICDVVGTGPWGWAESAPVIGENFKAHKHTPAQTARAEIELMVMSSSTQEEAAKKRKGKTLAFNGQLDPFKPISDTSDLPYLARQGQANTVASPTVTYPIWDITRTMLHLRQQQGVSITQERRAQVEAWFPQGVPENEVAGLKSRLLAAEAAPAPAPQCNPLKLVS
jgi:hypothetical protein